MKKTVSHKARKRCGYIYLSGFILVLISWGSCVFASDTPPDATVKETESVVQKPGSVDQEVHDQNLLKYILSTDYAPIRSILFDREAPLLGITWGGTLLYDIPLNNEPDGASSTLRLVKLSYLKKFNEKWDVRFNVNYNSAGEFELGNNYADYTGWKAAKVTFGVFDPAFSLEKVSQREGTTFMERAIFMAG